MVIKKGTRLTEAPKDFMLRTRLDKDTLNKLDELTKELKLNRSEVVRKGINEQYEKLKK